MGIGKTMKNMLGSTSADDTQLSPETNNNNNSEGTASTIDSPDPNYKPAREPGRARSFSLGRKRSTSTSTSNTNPSARKSSTSRKPPCLSSKYEELDRCVEQDTERGIMGYGTDAAAAFGCTLAQTHSEARNTGGMGMGRSGRSGSVTAGGSGSARRASDPTRKDEDQISSSSRGPVVSEPDAFKSTGV